MKENRKTAKHAAALVIALVVLLLAVRVTRNFFVDTATGEVRPLAPILAEK